MYYFIVNPASGSGRGYSVWKKVEAELKRLGIDYHAYLLSGKGEARQLASGFAGLKRPATVVAVGGDGTINEIINGLSSFENITFGCIPTGSGNDFVRSLALPKDPIEALHCILSPKTITPVNIGRTLHPAGGDGAGETVPGAGVCGAHFASDSFAVSSGVGYDAKVCYLVGKSKLKKALNLFHSGKLIYLVTALWQLFTMRPQTMQLTIDDTETLTYEDVYFIAAMNLPYEGGGFQFCPRALPDDDTLDLIIASGIPRLKILSLLPLAFSGRHIGHKGIHIIRCKKAAVKVQSPVCLHTDGEIPGGYQQAIFTLCETKLPVIRG